MAQRRKSGKDRIVDKLEAGRHGQIGDPSQAMIEFRQRKFSSRDMLYTQRSQRSLKAARKMGWRSQRPSPILQFDTEMA
ncbi:hypothetical protein NSE01_38690 [Novosphingobium sediminis]|uniref:Uncharacterized protein n=1 Tax=Novosphingobium sediminis TaxID=707214 RepID=A0A512AR42_9SPHN|nr:hypothetical protein NSE01_38690 [Novosphingobium sediminis]